MNFYLELILESVNIKQTDNINIICLKFTFHKYNVLLNKFSRARIRF